jgi:hypothetical protein
MRRPTPAPVATPDHAGLRGTCILSTEAITAQAAAIPTMRGEPGSAITGRLHAQFAASTRPASADRPESDSLGGGGQAIGAIERQQSTAPRGRGSSASWRRDSGVLPAGGALAARSNLDYATVPKHAWPGYV